MLEEEIKKDIVHWKRGVFTTRAECGDIPDWIVYGGKQFQNYAREYISNPTKRRPCLDCLKKINHYEYVLV